MTDTVIRLENPVPEEVEADTYVVENITFTPEVEVRNCEFRELIQGEVLLRRENRLSLKIMRFTN